MFKVTRSGYSAISSQREPEAKQTHNSKFGTTSKSFAKDKFESTSAPSMRVTTSPNTTVSGNAITIDMEPMLTGLTPNVEKVLHRIYRDIYYNESVAGCAVDLISTLPFSEFSLGGLASQKGDMRLVRRAYQETLERLNLRTLLPEMSVDYLVLGKHCSSLLYNKEKRMFTDILPHLVDNLTIEPLPFYSQDPIITAKFPEELRGILSRTSSQRVQRIREHLGANIVDKLISGSMELDPLSTIFIPRRTFSYSDTGTSYLRRIMPIYLIEKNLYRGTLIESARRQRGILHLTLGDGDTWIPTVQDLEFITELFMNADSDPLGAIIATRSGIVVEEHRQGGDFWKSTDFNDSVLSHKLRALGISEAFLSGDASYATGDAALSVFVDTIRNFRDMMTRKLFYNKLFPLISLINGFTTKNGRISVQENLISQMTSEQALTQLNDNSKLFVPTIHWTKQLKPEGDSQYMEMLNALTEKGVPVPLRALAAAGGMDLDTLILQQDEDIDVRKRLAEYTKRIAELTPKQDGDESVSAEDVMTANSDYLALASGDPSGQTRSSVLASKGKVSILNRDYSEAEPYQLSKTDKPRPILNRPAFERRANEKILKALKSRKRS
jgi:hypothetical protein